MTVSAAWTVVVAVVGWQPQLADRATRPVVWRRERCRGVAAALAPLAAAATVAGAAAAGSAALPRPATVAAAVPAVAATTTAAVTVRGAGQRPR